MIDFRLGDCVEGMKNYPDNYFDLAIVDPPYGDGGVVSKATTTPDSEGGSTDTRKTCRTGGTWASKYGKKSYRGI